MNRNKFIGQSAFALGCALSFMMSDQLPVMAVESTLIEPTSQVTTPTNNIIDTLTVPRSSATSSIEGPPSNMGQVETTTVVAPNFTTVISETEIPVQPSEKQVDFDSVDKVNSPIEVADPSKQKEIDNQLEITVLSDIHVLPETMIADNESFTIATNSDRKMFEESQAAFNKSLELAEKNGSKVLFITGDLTKDGEFESHEYVAQQLKAFQSRNPQVKIFLVPGNHDINNHSAINFDGGANGGQAVPATRTTPEMFMNVYKDLVFGNGAQLYKDSIEFIDYLKQVNQTVSRQPGHDYYAQGYTSYMGRVDMGTNVGENGLTVIGLDTAEYSADTTETGQDAIQNTEGQISEAQMAWAVRMAEEARKRNDVIMVLAHHAFMPHFYKQETLLAPYIIEQWQTPFESANPALSGKTPAEVLADAGIQYLFTGHMHAQDIAKFESKAGNPLYDIETGSTVSTPSPIRHLTLRNQIDATQPMYDLEIQSETLGSITYLDKNKNVVEVEDLTTHGKGLLITPDLVVGLANHYLNASSGNLSIQNIIGQFSKDLANSDNLGRDMIQLLASFLGDKTNPSVKTVGPGQLSIYYDEIEKTAESDKKIGLDIKANIMGFLQVAEPLMLSQDNAGLLLNDLMTQFNQEVLGDQASLNAFMYTWVNKLLNYEIVTDAQGAPKTLSDIANFAYIGHLKGNETQPEWIQSAVSKLQNENVAASMLQTLAPELADFILYSAEKLDYQQGDHPLNLMVLLEYDKTQPGDWDDFVKGVVVSAVGTNVKNTLETAGLDRDKLANLIGNRLLTMEALDSLIKPVNGLLANVVDGLTREPVEGYENAFIEDNDTLLSHTLTLEPVEGTFVTNPDGKVTFNHSLDTNRLKSIQYFVNGKTVDEVALSQLKQNDQLMALVQYRNEWNHFISYLSQTVTYQVPTKTIVQVIEETLPFGKIIKENPQLPKGQMKELVAGQSAKKLIKRSQVYDINGNLVGMAMDSLISETDQIDQVIEMGTLLAEAPKPEEKVVVSTVKMSPVVKRRIAPPPASLPATGEDSLIPILASASLALLTGLGLMVGNQREEIDE